MLTRNRYIRVSAELAILAEWVKAVVVDETALSFVPTARQPVLDAVKIWG